MKRTKHEYYITHEGEEFPLNFDVIDGSETVYINGDRAVVGYLVQDEDAESPRSDNNLGKMVCWHRRYNLGDEQPKNTSPAEYLRELAMELEEGLEERLENIPQENSRLYYEETQKAIDEVLDKNIVMLPLYLFDHSGLAMSTGSFNDPWDSGQVGFIYCTLTAAKANWSLPETATWNYEVEDWLEKGKKITLYQATERVLTGEVKTYDDYLQGKVYGVCFATFNRVEDKWEPDETDDCWGYIGDEHAEGQMKDEFETYWKPRILKPKSKEGA